MQFSASQPAQDLFKRSTLVSILAILHFIAAGAYLLACIALTFVVARFLSETDSKIPFFIIGGFCGLFMFLHSFTAIGLWKLRPYGRTLQIILAVVALLSIPIGTIIGVFVLIYMYKPEIKLLFSGKSAAELQPQEATQLSRLQTEGSGAGIAIALVAVFFVGIAVIGIIAAIAIPNLLNAIQRGKQKRTMADIRAIATACEAYGVDNNSYPKASTMEELIPKLEPNYVKTVPRRDAWESLFRYEAWNEESEPEGEGPYHYMIISYGKDGQADEQEYSKGTVTFYFNNDIVFSDGEFIVFPEGIQR